MPRAVRKEGARCSRCRCRDLEYEALGVGLSARDGVWRPRGAWCRILSRACLSLAMLRGWAGRKTTLGSGRQADTGCLVLRRAECRVCTEEACRVLVLGTGWIVYGRRRALSYAGSRAWKERGHARATSGAHCGRKGDHGMGGEVKAVMSRCYEHGGEER